MFQPAGDRNVQRAAPLEPWIADLDLRLHHHRHPDLWTEIELDADEAFWRDADHRKGRAVDVNGCSDNRAIARETCLPEVVIEDRERCRTRLLVVRLMKKPPQRGLQSQNVEVVAR